MADIAFLLLIFFLVATTIVQDKGLQLRLPQEKNDQQQPVNERNVFKILLNAHDELLVENQLRSSTEGLQNEIKTFILNQGKNPDWSDSPEKVVVSLKTSRGTKYKTFIEILDEAKGAYYEIYGERIGLTAEEFRRLRLSDPEQRAQYEKAREGFPMNISIAEPNPI